MQLLLLPMAAARPPPLPRLQRGQLRSSLLSPRPSSALHTLNVRSGHSFRHHVCTNFVGRPMASAISAFSKPSSGSAWKDLWPPPIKQPHLAESNGTESVLVLLSQRRAPHGPSALNDFAAGLMSCRAVGLEIACWVRSLTEFGRALLHRAYGEFRPGGGDLQPTAL